MVPEIVVIAVPELEFVIVPVLFMVPESVIVPVLVALSVRLPIFDHEPDRVEPAAAWFQMTFIAPVKAPAPVVPLPTVSVLT